MKVPCLVLLLLLGSTVSLFADRVGDARSALAKGDYGSVDDILERPLESAHPPMDVLALSFDANLAAGRWMTAAVRMDAILRAGGNQSAEWLWRGAQHAARMRDAVSERERYRRFVMMAETADTRTDQAFASLAQSVTDTKVFERYLALYGANEASWAYGIGVWTRLETIRGGEGFLTLARLLQGAFDTPDKRNAVAARLFDDAGKGRIPGGYRRAYGVVLEGSIHDAEMVRRFVEKLDWNYDLLLRGFEKALVPMDPYALDRLSGVAETEDIDRRLEIGRRILRKERLYRSSDDPRDYAHYLDVIADAPHVFRIDAQALLSPGEIQARLVELSQRPADWGELPKQLWLDTYDGYAQDRQQKSRLVAALPKWAHPDRLDDHFGTGNELRDRLIQANGDRLDVKLRHLGFYAQAPADKDELLRTAREGFSRYPGTYNGKHIGQTVFNAPSVSTAEKMALLKTALFLGGSQGPFRDLLSEAQRVDGLKALPALEALAAKAKGTVSARDALRDAHRQMQTAKGKDALRVLEEAFKAFSKPFPDGSRDAERNAIMAEIVEHFWSVAWHDASLVARGGALMAQHLGDDADWWQKIVRRTREHRQTDALGTLALAYAVGIKRGWHSDARVWNDFSMITPAKGVTESPLAPYYQYMSPAACREHLGYLGNLSREAWLKECERVLSAHPIDTFSRSDVKWVLETLYEEARRHKLPLPATLLEPYWSDFTTGHYASDDEMRHRYMRLYEHGANTPEVLTRYVNTGTTPLGRTARFIEVYDWLGRFFPAQKKDAPTDTTLSHRQGLRAAMLDTHLKGVSATDYPELTFREGLVEDVLQASRQSAPGGAAQLAAIARVVGGGGALRADGRSAWALLAEPIKAAATTGDWPVVYNSLREAARLPLHVNYYADARNNSWGPVTEALETAQGWEALHFMCSRLLAQQKTRWGKPVPENVKSWLQTTRARTLRHIPGAYPVQEDDPAFTLYVAADEWALGNQGRAWALVEGDIPRFSGEWVKLDKDYIVWVLEQLRRRQRLNDARTLLMNVLKKESYLTAEHLASVRLVKADIYRDSKNYEAARIEYESLRLDDALVHTGAARTAKCRILELMIMTGDYEGAEVILERWRTHSQSYMRAQAHCFSAVIAFKQKGYDAARSALQKTFDITSDHVEARLLEGEIKALTGKGVGEPEIPVGARGEREYIVPGRTLSVTLTDRNLAVVKQGQAVPVIVSTTVGQDHERIELYPGAAKPNEFRASIGTRLGSVNRDSLVLDMMGSDEVLYEVDPVFVRANGIEPRPAKRLRVLDDARLSASAGRILTETEEIDVRLEQQGADGEEAAKRDYGRSGTSVRPGNPVYVLVRDLDRDVSDWPDAVNVRVETSSGDVVDAFALTESRKHSGVFRGEIPSALPPPRASASDEAEGHPVSALINSEQSGPWTSFSDGESGKWVEVDTMSSYETARVALHLPNPERIRRATLLGGLVGEPHVLGVFPVAEPTSNDVPAPIAIIQRDESGLVASLATTPRLRTLRWQIDDYEGQSLSATAFEIVTAGGDAVVPAKEDFSSASRNAVIEMAPGDRVDVSYRDEVRTRNAAPVLHANLVSTYFNGRIAITHETVVAGAEGRVSSRLNEAVRYALGDRVVIVVTEHDLDVSADADTVPVTVTTSSGESLLVLALEQGARSYDSPDAPVHSGVFHAVLTLGTETGGDTLRVVAGDGVTASYLDEENMNPGIPFEREYSMREAGHDDPALGLFGTRTERVEDGSEGARNVLAQMALRGEDMTGVKVYRDQMVATLLEPTNAAARVSMGVPLMFEVAQPSAALHSGSTLIAMVYTESEIDAAAAAGREPKGVEVTLVLGSMQGLASSMGYAVAVENGSDSAGGMVEQGLFRGMVQLQVGAAPDTGEEDADLPLLSVSGKDRLVVRVKNARTEEWVSRTAQLASQARFALLDDSYTADRTLIHMGERFYVRVVDRDQNHSAELDRLEVQVKAHLSQQAMTLVLKETLPYSGVFTGFLQTRLLDTSPIHTNRQEDAMGVAFGDTLTFLYHDAESLQGGSTNLTVVGHIRRGADGAVTGFSKRFADPEMAVKVRFLRAEALFAMAKEHYALKNLERSFELISEGKHILEEALCDYPDTVHVSQGRFLLANLAQELARVEEDPAQQHKLLNEAIARYAHIISSWPESDFAPQSQYRMAICLETLEEYDRSTEEYVKLTYTWPEHSLVPEATVRLANHYYRTEQYPIAARIFLSFYKNNPSHPLAAKTLFLGSQCYIKHGQFLAAGGGDGVSGADKAYGRAVASLRDLIDEFPDEKELRSESLYWLGDTYFKLRNFLQSYIALKKLTWDYPETKWAQYARGYLTDEKFANIDQDN